MLFCAALRTSGVGFVQRGLSGLGLFLRTLSLALRSLRARPSRTVLTMFGIVMGVAVILAISVANATTVEALANLFGEAAGKSHLVVTSTDVRGDGFAESVVRQVAAVPGVEAAVPTLQTQALLADDSAGASDTMMSFLGMASGGLTLFGIYPEEDGAAREYKMVEGRTCQMTWTYTRSCWSKTSRTRRG